VIGYSLWHEPWIPVVQQSGETSTVSLRDALAEAHSLREVYDPSPLINVAIHRLLLAVLYRVYRPRNVRDWTGLWRAARFDSDRLDGYGGVWSDRFDLFHPTHPFYQVPFIADEKVHPITAMILEAASGNNPTLFDHGQAEGMDALPLDRAACHLVTHQLFAVGGGVSKPFNRMDAPLTKGLVVEAKGRTLFETLLLNLMPLDRWASLVPDSGEDCPFWELAEPPEPMQRGTLPLGPMHYLTWQSRQIHLCVGGAPGQVTGCQIRQRYCLPKDGNRVDPGKPYRKSEEEGWLPFKVDKQRAAWQFTHVLLQRAVTNQSPPELIFWLAEAEGLGLDLPGVIGMTVSGLTTHPKRAAKIELWRREQLPIPAALLEKPALVGDLEDLLRQASRVELFLRRAAQALVWALGERQKLPEALKYLWTGQLLANKIPPGLLSLAESLGLVTRYWPLLEAPFRQVLAELPRLEFDAVQESWRTAVRRAASQSFQAARDSLLHADASFEVLTNIDHAFQSRLVRIFTEKTKEVTPNDEEPDE
jgi:CRISPR system Cascade subunit CasA